MCKKKTHFSKISLEKRHYPRSPPSIRSLFGILFLHFYENSNLILRKVICRLSIKPSLRSFPWRNNDCNLKCEVESVTIKILKIKDYGKRISELPHGIIVENIGKTWKICISEMYYKFISVNFSQIYPEWLFYAFLISLCVDILFCTFETQHFFKFFEIFTKIVYPEKLFNPASLKICCIKNYNTILYLQENPVPRNSQLKN